MRHQLHDEFSQRFEFIVAVLTYCNLSFVHAIVIVAVVTYCNLSFVHAIEVWIRNWISCRNWQPDLCCRAIEGLRTPGDAILNSSHIQ